MVELLKQDQYVPLPVEKQAVLIYAGTRQMIPDGKTASKTAYFPTQKLAAPAGSAVAG